MAKMLAVELGPSRIRLNVVCPGAIDTNIGESTHTRDLSEVKIPVEYTKGAIPLTGNIAGTPEDVAELIAFLASDRAPAHHRLGNLHRRSAVAAAGLAIP